MKRFAFILFWVVWAYVMIVLNISSYYYQTAIDYNLSAIDYYLFLDKEKGDSCSLLGRYYHRKGDNVGRLIPFIK